MFIKGNKICTLWSSKGAKKANLESFKSYPQLRPIILLDWLFVS